MSAHRYTTVTSLRGAPLGPLDGVPLSIKHITAAAGLARPVAVTACQNYKAINAPVLDRSRKAAAVIAGSPTTQSIPNGDVDATATKSSSFANPVGLPVLALPVRDGEAPQTSFQLVGPFGHGEWQLVLEEQIGGSLAGTSQEHV